MTRLSLENYNTLPRVSGLVLSPDGRRLVMTVQTLSPDGIRFITSLWDVPADGSASPRRLTFSDKGEANPAFLPDGSLVFSSGRVDPTVKEDEAEGRLWVLPAAGGEARPLLSVAGGIRAIATARDTDTVVVRVQLFPEAGGLGEDAEKGKHRKEAGTSAILYETFPIRYWDHDLGPRWSRLLRLRGVLRDERPEAEDLTPEAMNNMEEGSFSLAPDGETVVSTWTRAIGKGFRKEDLVAIRGGERRTLAAGDLNYGQPQVSPDGLKVVASAEDEGTMERATRIRLWLGDLREGGGRVVAEDFANWPEAPVWAPDGSAVYFAADETLQRPIFRLDTATGDVKRLTEEGSFTAICPAPAGDCVYALRSSWSSPLEVVRVGLDGAITSLPTPGLPLELPGHVSRVDAMAEDGTPVRSWLVMPEGASDSNPAPLVLWIHGGPFSSWNTWSWRWCPHLLAERGYAVLLPDPALSTGYGQPFIERAWGVWGDRVLKDVFAALDSALARPDIDAARTAAMGGSFGGYMSNWVAGHSDRFRAIVTHASLWSLEQFRATTDDPTWWEQQFGSPYEHPERYAAASPERGLPEVRTPMLVIHGNLDYRVPISEALRLWTDLVRHEVPAKYLYFPDENHWVLKPGNARVWYETVLAFLDHHVLGKEWRRPALL
jgi:dipeptidyl aminopeptidase/acylaminoacyl peptidase